jgi:AcrR family transcriptional regulator
MNRVMSTSRAETYAPEPRDLRSIHRDDTRRMILEAFLALLEDESPTAVSMPEIAARAGVSVRTLYRYFPNKDALIDGANRWFERHAAAALGGRPTEFHQLPTYLENIWSDFAENIPAVRIQHTSAGGREFRARRLPETRAAIEAALPAGIPEERRPLVVDTVAALMSSSMFFELVERLGHRPAEAARMASHVITLLVDNEVDHTESTTP